MFSLNSLLKNSILFLFSVYNILNYYLSKENDSKLSEVFFSLPTFFFFKLLPTSSYIYFAYLSHISFLHMFGNLCMVKSKTQKANWELRLRLTDLELGCTDIWGHCLLGNLFDGLCSWAGWISRMHFSILCPGASGSGCWISEREEWVSLHSAFIVDIIFGPPLFPHVYFLWYLHSQVCW